MCGQWRLDRLHGMRCFLSPGLAALCLLTACGRPAAGPTLPVGVEAMLSASTLTVALPLADSAEVWLAARQRFHWRITAPGAPPLSYGIVDSIANRPTPLRQRLVQGEVSRCAPEGHILMCARRLPTRGAFVNGQLVIEVRDPEIVSLWALAQTTQIQRGVWLVARRVRFDAVPLNRVSGH